MLENHSPPGSPPGSGRKRINHAAEHLQVPPQSEERENSEEKMPHLRDGASFERRRLAFEGPGSSLKKKLSAHHKPLAEKKGPSTIK